jgi:1-pyrroline-5-carboxylate dehydrogenase
LVHESADTESVAIATIRSAYEYSGQKCSACSRLYVPESKWPQLKERLISLMSELKIDSPLNFSTFTSAVIDEKAFDRIVSYINYGIHNQKTKLVYGGENDKSRGYYVNPTLFECKDPNDKLLREEIFGPVLAVYVYKNADYAKCLDLIDSTTPYALTGSIFAQDEQVLESTRLRLRQSCGNLYINDKSTGAGDYFLFFFQELFSNRNLLL